MHVHAHPYIPAQTSKMTRKVGKQQTRTKRPVRFAESVAGLITVACRLPDTNDKEDKGLWYDAVEMKTIRNSVMMVAAASRQHGLDRLLEGTIASTEPNTKMPQDRHHV